MATYKDVISTVKTALNRGIGSSDDRLSARYIISVALRKRQRVLKQEQEKKSWNDKFSLQVIPCMELIEVDEIECACLPASARGCKVLRTKEKVPKPIKDLSSVMFLNGDQVNPVGFGSNRDKLRLTVLRKSIGYYLVNNYIYIVNEHNKKFIRIEAIFEDPYEPSTVGCEVAGANDSCCASYLDIDFPVPNGLLDSIVVLTAEEISTFWQYGVNDMTNDGIQTQPALPASRSRGSRQQQTSE